MKVVIVEDSELISSQICRVLRAEPRIHILGIATEESTALALILSTNPDAVLLDLSLSPGSGMAVLRQMRQAHIGSRVYVLTNNTEAAIRAECEALGVSGFYDKSEAAEECFQKLYAALPPLAPNEARRLEGLQPRIAVLEDEPEMLLLIQTMLAHSGFTVDTFRTAGELVRSPLLGTYHAAVLDLSLPDLDFFEMVEQAADRLAPSPLVLFTGHSSATLEAAALFARHKGCTVQALIRKPFDAATLCAALGIAQNVQPGEPT